MMGSTVNQASAQLVRISPTSGSATRVGAPGTESIHSLAFTENGVLYAAIEGDNTSDRLVEINSATGLITRNIGPIGFTPVFGMAITPDEQNTGAFTLYASSYISETESKLLTIDPATGIGTEIATLDNALFDLTFISKAISCDEEYTLNIIAYGVYRDPVDATGLITSAPAGIECANKFPTGTCEAIFTAGTTVTLLATPDSGFFAGPWLGDDTCDEVTGDSSQMNCKVTMDSDKQITGTFDSILP